MDDKMKLIETNETSHHRGDTIKDKFSGKVITDPTGYIVGISKFKFNWIDENTSYAVIGKTIVKILGLDNEKNDIDTFACEIIYKCQ